MLVEKLDVVVYSFVAAGFEPPVSTLGMVKPSWLSLNADGWAVPPSVVVTEV